MNKNIQKNSFITELWENESQEVLKNLLQVAPIIPEINSYLSEETIQLKAIVNKNSSVIDFGCGNGRHLNEISHKIREGLGIDVNNTSLNEAINKYQSESIGFIKSDIEKFRAEKLFDMAISMYNTIGIVSNPKKAIHSMLSSIKTGGIIVISLYSYASIPHRVKMYKLMGLNTVTVLKNKIVTEEGFISRHYSKSEILKLLPAAEISTCSEFGWFVISKKV